MAILSIVTELVAFQEKQSAAAHSGITAFIFSSTDCGGLLLGMLGHRETGEDAPGGIQTQEEFPEHSSTSHQSKSSQKVRGDCPQGSRHTLGAACGYYGVRCHHLPMSTWGGAAQPL